MLELDNIKNRLFKNTEKLYVHVNNCLWGVVDNFDDVIKISDTIVSDIKKRKPHYKINLASKRSENTITITAISHGMIKNNYYVYNVVYTPVQKFRTPSPFDVEIEHPSGDIEVIKVATIPPPPSECIVPVFEISNVFKPFT